MERTTNLDIFCSYLERCTTSEDNCIANRKLTTCYNINMFRQIMGKLYIISIKKKELCMKGNPYACLKGNNSCKGNGANGLLVFKSTFNIISVMIG